jgi:MFS transporter, DHA2 family, multidrug resistance protein
MTSNVETRQWLAVAGALVGAFMAILDIQITNSSLKDIQASIGATLDEASWVATSYLVAEMIAIPLTGFFAAWLSPRRYLLWNSAAFVLASLACSTSWSLESMVVFRALQGFTGGALIPMAFNLIVTQLPADKRPMGMALFGVTATFAPSIGPSLGGWLTETFSWHYIFYINVLPGLLVMTLLGMGLERRPMDPKQLLRIDAVGMISMGLGLGCLQVLLEEGARDDWFDAVYIRWLAFIATVSLCVFVRRQLRTDYPLVNLRLFANRDFTFSCLAYMMLGVGLFGSVFLVPLYLATNHDYTALDIGLVLMWVGFPQLPFFPLIPKILRYVQARYLVAFGFAVMAASMFMNMHMSVLTDGGFLIPALLLRALGQPFVMVPLSIMSSASLAPSEVSSASTLFNVMRNLGGAMGIAALSTLLQDSTRANTRELTVSLAAGSQNGADYMASLSAATGLVEGSPAMLSMIAQEIQRQAYVMACNEAFVVIGCALLLASLAVLMVRNKPAVVTTMTKAESPATRLKAGAVEAA